MSWQQMAPTGSSPVPTIRAAHPPEFASMLIAPSPRTGETPPAVLQLRAKPILLRWTALLMLMTWAERTTELTMRSIPIPRAAWSQQQQRPRMPWQSFSEGTPLSKRASATAAPRARARSVPRPRRAGTASQRSLLAPARLLATNATPQMLTSPQATPTTRAFLATTRCFAVGRASRVPKSRTSWSASSKRRARRVRAPT
mmetsp:Transcript_11463/g.48056  ORF Transcript_11463/g.48056 Transcript_11463/m.48056 type:complete len:200 (-) Transcript_11463:755-1354(-)